MTTKTGTIWAQAVWWNSTGSTKTRHLVFAKGRHITAYSTISQYTFFPPYPIDGPPWFCTGETGIVWYRAFGQEKPSPGEEFASPLPYLQADHVTEMKIRLSAGLVLDGGCYIRAVHVINFFEPK